MRIVKGLLILALVVAVPLAVWAAEKNPRAFERSVLRITSQSPSPPASLTPKTPPKANKNNFVAHLSGRAMLPNPVNTLAQGQVIFKVDEGSETIHFQLITAHIENVIMAHIHLTPLDRSAIGPVIVWLFPNVGPVGPPLADEQAVDVNGVLAAGVITNDDLSGVEGIDTISELALAMRNNETAVVVHTVQNRPGELRGEIH